MKRINYFYLLMIAIICAVVLNAQRNKSTRQVPAKPDTIRVVKGGKL